jgi:hypothetical protein
MTCRRLREGKRLTKNGPAEARSRTDLALAVLAQALAEALALSQNMLGANGDRRSTPLPRQEAFP